MALMSIYHLVSSMWVAVLGINHQWDWKAACEMGMSYVIPQTRWEGDTSITSYLNVP